jgi:hypothetical protein
MREQFGNSFHLEPRSRKHRYIYFIGNKRDKRRLRAALRYPVFPYPKMEVPSVG